MTVLTKNVQIMMIMMTIATENGIGYTHTNAMLMFTTIIQSREQNILENIIYSLESLVTTV